MFPPRDRLSMGISTPELTFHADDPILIYVWVNNRTPEEKTLLSCSMWWDWNVEVYDSQSHAVGLRREPPPKDGYTVDSTNKSDVPKLKKAKWRQLAVTFR